MSDEIQVDLMLRDAGTMRATAEVAFTMPLGSLCVSGFKVIETEPGKPWVSLPSKEYTKDGVRKFQKLLELSKPLARAVQDAILKAYREALGV